MVTEEERDDEIEADRRCWWTANGGRERGGLVQVQREESEREGRRKKAGENSQRSGWEAGGVGRLVEWAR